ncbi:MAG: LysR family transcriptional regulator [Pseudomonadota bacterium]
MRNISSIDLNLLVVFDALMLERNVTKAGKRIGLAQSSMSNALTRLRNLFDDELFTRTSEGMMPTAIAMQAVIHVRKALEAAENAINIGRIFDPKTASAEVTILVSDYVEALLFSKVFDIMNSQAPGVFLYTKPFDREWYAAQMDENVFTIAMGAVRAKEERFNYETLFSEEFVCIAQKNHPNFSQRLTLDAFLSSKHVLVSMRKDGGTIVDDILERIGHNRKSVARVSSFTSLLYLIAQTEMISVIPKRLALLASKTLDIDIFALPFEVPPFTISMVWNKQVDGMPIHQWIRELIKQSIDTI